MSAPARCKNEVLLLDFYAGRVLGHSDHYLRSLEAVFRNSATVVWAPYRDGWGRDGLLTGFAQKLALGWRALHPPKGTARAVVVQNPGAAEKLMLTLVSLSRPSRAIAVFVLRRSGDDLNARERPWLSRGSRLAQRAVTLLIRRGWLYPVSDSALALDYWKERAGVSHGSAVALPPPPGIDAGELPPREGGPVVALVGSFRAERGAGHYDAIIEAATDLVDDVSVDVQLGGSERDGSAPIAAALRQRWQHDQRVRLHEGYLSDREYAGLLARADVAVLPYDAASYTTGTSGVVHEALTLGATVVTSPLAWAAQQFAGHPRLHFVEDWNAETVRRELPLLVRSAIERRDVALPAPGDDFAADWIAAVDEALLHLRRRA